MYFFNTHLLLPSNNKRKPIKTPLLTDLVVVQYLNIRFKQIQTLIFLWLCLHKPGACAYENEL